MRNKCSICDREKESGSDLCYRHEKAYKNLKKVYIKWKKAVNIDWNEYLKEVIEIPETGTWVKEVALNLINNQKTQTYL
ncbi:hypothetical protein KEJ21_04245 [Candidatus Bathyarchaeota archaeon]|nr:hypothetical protein [Candidatus Bathyarchaeota archaeon]MBS7630318.1 hypothetical protein [Candidatus Bathyarchaeota archaeon]